jgi:hypothetical protein
MTKEIPLTKGKVALIDDDDYEKYGALNWHCVGGRYAARSVGGRTNRKMIYLHRLIVVAKDGENVDHINGDKLDNRKQNLRIVTQQQNRYNSEIRNDNKSGYKGVHYHKQSKRWYAYVGAGVDRSYLGYFDNPHDAARMYNFWAIDIYGEYARVNVINETEAV